MTSRFGSVVLALSMFVIDSPALTPPPEPHNHVIRSDNGRFYAAVNARRDSTAIKRARRWWFDKHLWTVRLYFEEAVVSNDGTYLFTWSGGEWAPKCSKQTPILHVWLSDGSTRHFAIGDFVSDLNRMSQTQVMGAWMASWGSVSGSQGDWIKVETCEKRALFANVKTGEVRPQMTSGKGR